MQLKLNEKQLVEIKNSYVEISKMREEYQTKEEFRANLTETWESILNRVTPVLNGEEFSKRIAIYEIEFEKAYDWDAIKEYIIGRNLFNKSLSIPQFYGLYSINTKSPKALEDVINECNYNLCQSVFTETADRLADKVSYPVLWACALFLTNASPLIPAEIKPHLENFLSFLSKLDTSVFINTLDRLINWNPDAKKAYLDYVAIQIEHGLFSECILETDQPNTFAIGFEVDTFWEFIKNLNF